MSEKGDEKVAKRGERLRPPILIKNRKDQENTIQRNINKSIAKNYEKQLQQRTNVKPTLMPEVIKSK